LRRSQFAQVKADELLHAPRLESAFCRFFTGVRTAARLSSVPVRGGRVQHFAALRAAGRGIDIPFFCRRHHEHGSRGCTVTVSEMQVLEHVGQVRWRHVTIEHSIESHVRFRQRPRRPRPVPAESDETHPAQRRQAARSRGKPEPAPGTLAFSQLVAALLLATCESPFLKAGARLLAGKPAAPQPKAIRGRSEERD
jgi:hypothetical protein